ncbi:MAG TPA: response regulator transcription factor [Thermoleophilaceae bacterium]|jgi:DNA-binding CsgD family transcriptional regulator
MTAAVGTLDEQLGRRVERATAQAATLLGDGMPSPPDDGDAQAALAQIVDAVTAALADAAGSEPWTDATDLHRLQLQLVRRRFERRFEALERVRQSLVRLREITSPGVMIARAPEELCAASGFDRALLSRIRDGALVPESAYFADDAAGAAKAIEDLRELAPRLQHPMIETEVMRRRRATIVLEARLHPRVHREMAELMGWESYAAAALVIQGEVVGLLHADRLPSGRQVDALDRDVLWAFALGYAQVLESATLRRTLRRERDQTRRFLDWLNARSGQLSDAALDLSAEEPPPASAAASLSEPLLTEGRDDRAVFDGLLTRRELDVLRLMARGKTNSAVAAELVISEGTVKFHVNNILRKLHAGNRAEAASRYLRLTGGRVAP